MSSKPTPNLKQNTVLAFDDGLLTIKQSGHGDANGWGELAFHERQVEIDPDGFHKVEIPPSELRELRDFLNRTLPAAETGLTPQQLRADLNATKNVLGATREHVQRLEVERDELLKLLRRWNAIDAGSWAPDRHANEKRELIADTRAAIAKVEQSK